MNMLQTFKRSICSSRSRPFAVLRLHPGSWRDHRLDRTATMLALRRQERLVCSRRHPDGGARGAASTCFSLWALTGPRFWGHRTLPDGRGCVSKLRYVVRPFRRSAFTRSYPTIRARCENTSKPSLRATAASAMPAVSQARTARGDRNDNWRAEDGRLLHHLD
jgi:hypothetical protein